VYLVCFSCYLYCILATHTGFGIEGSGDAEKNRIAMDFLL
jgi:hypothetical protein